MLKLPSGVGNTRTLQRIIWPPTPPLKSQSCNLIQFLRTIFVHQALLQAHDEVLKNSSGDEVNPYQSGGSPGYNNRQMEDSVGDRPEKLTRVRLVQFHKHPNEPMVSLLCKLYVCVVNRTGELSGPFLSTKTILPDLTSWNIFHSSVNMCGFDQAGGQDGWILIGQVIFCLFIDQDKGKVDNNAKKNDQAWSLLICPKR